MTTIFVATTKRKKKDLFLSIRFVKNIVALLIMTGLFCKQKSLNFCSF